MLTIAQRLRLITEAVLVFALLAATDALAQEQTPESLQKKIEKASAEATSECARLWSDHAFDSLRKRIPLEGEKPTFTMLKNPERLKKSERPMADRAIATLEKCRKAWEPVYALLPTAASERIRADQRLQDIKIAELYSGKITFGEFNVATSTAISDFVKTFSGVSLPSATDLDQKSLTEVAKPIELPNPQSQKFAPGTRIALVIGNGNYANLPKLANSVGDAKSISESLSTMGYSARLLLDGSEQLIRRELRQFANDSQTAEVAIVYYAGHGAQVNGSNYILPTDVEIPRTEVDIQFSGLKVDDLVNSVGSATKVVFLDACRDNPAIYKNLVKGRGSSPTGLAPSASSNFDQKPGIGIFIAYATEAGAVAEDGNLKHSPFTQALLRNLQKPISIDDMFSLVTKEVRLVTKNTQRPYKYASLENILCLSPSCTGVVTSDAAPNAVLSSPVEQAKQSEATELSVARATNKVAALQTYLTRYPDTPDRREIEKQIARLKRADLKEWTLFEFGNQKLPQYVQLSSIVRFRDRAVVNIRWLVDPDAPKKVFFGKDIPDARFAEDLNVYDCKESRGAASEETILGRDGTRLFHYKQADPQYLNLAVGFTFAPDTSIGASFQRIACNDEVSTPLLTKEQLAKMEFKLMSSTTKGDGEIFFEELPELSTENEKAAILILRFYSDQALVLPPNAIFDTPPPTYRIEVDRVFVQCRERRLFSNRSEYYSASLDLNFLQAPTNRNWIELKPEIVSPLQTLHGILCESKEADK
jgi:uncharacterized caspase-like protein